MQPPLNTLLLENAVGATQGLWQAAAGAVAIYKRVKIATWEAHLSRPEADRSRVADCDTTAGNRVGPSAGAGWVKSAPSLNQGPVPSLALVGCILYHP